ncbi:hypothetical protein BDY19DRAFT_906337 [Irpex rosettiformis]|uniref:Uncharacterized protein n=1 Tax=Irpex rosettiformis TaxID=378272 RepID=A0ACB8U389_9APHY|nr:hypothetical protein BDY19DRAFT_906337 [Irpex rosettiformis]
MSRPSTPHRPTRLVESTTADDQSPPKPSRTSAIEFAEPSIPSGSTPPSPTRGRMTLRYPSTLSRDPKRVPLHKRGKSRTYETMEDLLREAGYKETRIFTPETERAEGAGEGLGRTASRVVEYLTGLVPGMNRSEEQLVQEDSKSSEVSQLWSMPPSPLAGGRNRVLPPDLDTSKEFTTRERASAPGSPRFGPGRGRLSHEQSLRPRPSASDSLRAYAQLSAAQGYLRHMSSTPNFKKNPRLISESGESDMTSVRLPSRARGRDRPFEEQPPLPSGWFDSVTKAVLGSPSTNAHVGQPRPSSRASARPSVRMQQRTSPHPASNDQTNKVRPMVSLRSQTAPGAVNTVKVVCQSAPSSRSSSRIGQRLTFAADQSGTLRRDSRSRAPRRSRGEQTDALPSLASTLLEDDSWGSQWMDGKRIPSIAIEDTDYSDDDDGELNLAQLLLPPKRQKSIRSLRQHLHRSESARGSRTPLSRPLEPYILDDDDDVASRRKDRSREGRTHRWTSSDEGSGWEGSNLPGVDQQGPRRRRGLPNAWSSLATGR